MYVKHREYSLQYYSVQQNFVLKFRKECYARIVL